MAQSIEIYTGLLEVQKHRLDDHLEFQASFMQEIAEQFVRSNNKANSLKDEVQQVEARVAADIRDTQEKTTVAEIDSKLKRSPERIAAFVKYQVAKAEADRWGALLDAWKAKGFAIKTLADLYSAQYFSVASHQSRQKHEDSASRPLPHYRDASPVPSSASAPNRRRRADT